MIWWIELCMVLETLRLTHLVRSFLADPDWLSRLFALRPQHSEPVHLHWRNSLGSGLALSTLLNCPVPELSGFWEPGDTGRAPDSQRTYRPQDKDSSLRSGSHRSSSRTIRRCLWPSGSGACSPEPAVLQTPLTLSPDSCAQTAPAYR